MTRSLAVVLALLAFALPEAAHAQARSADTLRVPGLRAPVEIVRDRYGVAHIYAANENDLFFAQGYNAARDRLFQFELWRRQATGTVAEILGPRELDRDIGARLHRFRGDLHKELAHYHPRGEAIVGAFVRGVNAYVREARAHPESLPVEFRLLGIQPEEWTPDVVISRHQGLLGNITSELRIGRAVARLGAEKVKDLGSFGPGDPDLRLDPSIDGAALSADILHLYDAFRAPVRFERSDVVASSRGDEAAYRRLAAALPPSETEIAASGEAIGSNNWVLAGSKTASGKPLLANDPHRVQQAPSLRYFVHLVAPGWNVIGGGEPVLPGVSIGHNEHGAWGLTVFDLDGEDLYAYETNPANPNQYRYRGAWEDMRIVRDTIRVKGAAPVVVQLRYTRHGPVEYQDTAAHRAWALRAAWLDIGAAPYLASLRMDQATTWEEFRAACAYSRIPGENMIWADRAGNIGWQAVGVAPVRRSWSGLVPVPGDGRFEWDGYLPIPELPHAANPAAGFVATANQDDLPQGYAHRNAVGWEWADPFRFRRITEVLSPGKGFTVQDMARLQHDVLSIPARTLVPLALRLNAAEPGVAAALDSLRRWDFRMDTASVAAGIYGIWERELMEATTAVVVPPDARSLLRLGTGRMVSLLASPDAHLGASPAAARDSILLRALSRAVAELGQRLGPDSRAWRYGAYHHALLHHPMSPAVSDDVRRRLDVGPAPRGGNANTPNATGNGDNQTAGASLRMVADLADWERSIATNTPGQSGDPASPHYRDLFPLWASGEYFPLAYGRERVAAVAENRTVLRPAGR
ncbi:MAG TPA: penicillin acylase family protein [Longimicrobiales bacterium]|nr:penicillin acylase family protein [Longimicrobiales bacterium]